MGMGRPVCVGETTSGWDLLWSTGASSVHFEADPYTSSGSIAISEAEFWCLSCLVFPVRGIYFPVLLPHRCRKLLCHEAEYFTQL